VAAKEEITKDVDKLYPWGSNTGTYKLWLALITINILAVAVLFLVQVEIPLIAEITNPESIKGSSGSLIVGNETGTLASTGSRLGSGAEVAVGVSPVVDWLDKYGMWVIVGNIVLVTVLKTVGKWLNVVEKWCRNLCKCKWYKPWCCLGRLFCWFVTVVKWVTWVIAIVSSVVTSALVWVSGNSGVTGG
jgi:hypothetical protein